MNWKHYFNTEGMLDAKRKVSKLKKLEAIKVLRNEFKISFKDSLDFAEAFSL